MSQNSTLSALAIHTSSPQLGLALRNLTGETRQQTWDLGRELSVQLHSLLVEFIHPQTWTDLGFLAVAQGPGSFTGTRIGVVTARTLAQQLEIPVFAISSLAAIAWSAVPDKSQTQIIALQMPAQRAQLFTAIYQITVSGATPLLPDTVMTVQDWHDQLNHWHTPYQFLEAPIQQGVCASSLLELAELDWLAGKRPHWETALPFYGQHPVD